MPQIPILWSLGAMTLNPSLPPSSRKTQGVRPPADSVSLFWKEWTAEVELRGQTEESPRLCSLALPHQRSFKRNEENPFWKHFKSANSHTKCRKSQFGNKKPPFQMMFLLKFPLSGVFYKVKLLSYLSETLYLSPFLAHSV